jgi:hypothetical protein
MTGMGLELAVVGEMYGLWSRLLGGGGTVQVGCGSAKQSCCGAWVGWGTELGAGTAACPVVVTAGAGRALCVAPGVADGECVKGAEWAVGLGQTVVSRVARTGEPAEHALSATASTAAPATMTTGTTPVATRCPRPRRAVRYLIAGSPASNV